MCGVQPSRYDFHLLYFHLIPPRPIWVEASLTCWRYCPAVSGVRWGARGAGVDVEPVGHFGLVFGSGMFILEYVGDLAFFTVVWALDGPWAGLQGTT